MRDRGAPHPQAWGAFLVPARPVACPSALDLVHELSTVEHERLETDMGTLAREWGARETRGGLESTLGYLCVYRALLPSALSSIITTSFC